MNDKDDVTSEQYHVMREGGTEAPFTGKYLHTEEDGMFHCAACGNALFASGTKFDSGTGWPSFDAPVNRENVDLIEDDSMGMKRTEVRCRKCGAHLGHVFDDGPTGTGKRYCINSVCLDFKEGESKETI